MRWTDEEYASYLAQSGTAERLPAEPPVKVPKPAKVSRLELELAGHLQVMGLRPVAQFRFDPDRRWRFDFAFPLELVVVDVDGGVYAAENGETAGRHARGAGIVAGFEKRNAAAERGFTVLCYGPPQIRSGEAATQIERIVRSRQKKGAD